MGGKYKFDLIYQYFTLKRRDREDSMQYPRFCPKAPNKTCFSVTASAFALPGSQFSTPPPPSPLFANTLRAEQ